MSKRRTTTSVISTLLRTVGKRGADLSSILFITGEQPNRVTAALYWLTVAGAVDLQPNGRYRATPERDQRVRTIEFIVDGITRNRSGVTT